MTEATESESKKTKPTTADEGLMKETKRTVTTSPPESSMYEIYQQGMSTNIKYALKEQDWSLVADFNDAGLSHLILHFSAMVSTAPCPYIFILYASYYLSYIVIFAAQHSGFKEC